MARVINLRYPATCADCGAKLEVGTEARWYGRGKVYGTTCHPQTQGKSDNFGRRRQSGQKLVWWGGKQVPGTQCEDAPCCGCCGPGSDDPAYHESDPYDAYDRD